MKKYLLSALLIMFSVVGFSQKTSTPEPIKIQKSKLKEIKTVQELSTQVPKTIVMCSIDMVAKCDGKQVNVNNFEKPGKQDGTLSSEMLVLLNRADLNKKIYVDVKYRVSDDTPIQVCAFSIIVVE